ncbi:unnamed protein product [Rotaria socialis]|uniref:Uncharacterized protein n=2 Tax=Rotaria socialis TaxID=392032 RepID=A0A820PBG3_9BILA|nr:unnamed protein product [Rotaria socialis]CAF4561468.1 unnamed protein product [Rotaria socialis]
MTHKYETLVGERGIQLSGGEKQRIALARALIKQPNVLLLDEATSALDNANERIVQEALDRNRKDRTTIIIAHRLNTIKNADYIYVLENGVLIEEGTHENLMVVPEGRYQAMFKRQEIERISDNMDDTPYMQKVTEEENLAYEYSHRLSMSEMVAEHKAVEKPFSQISVFLRLLTMNRPEWIIILIGCIGCIFVGGSQSLFGFLLARAFKYYPGAKQRSHVLNASLIFLLVGVFILIARLVQYTAFAISGSKLTQRFRSQAFECLLRQEVAYFDRIEHSSGVISAHLSSGAIAVQELAGTRSGVICEIIALMLFGIALGSSLHWQIGLIIAASLCTFLIIIYTKCRIVAPLNEQIDSIAGQSSMFAIEVVQNLRTVKHLLVEKEVLRKYTGFVKQISILFRKSLIISTIEFSIYWAFDLYVLAFLYLCTFNLLKNHEIFANNIMMVLSVAIFSTQASKVIGFMSNRLAASFSGAEYFFNIFDRKPYIDNGSTEGQLLVDFHGNISFDQVKFIYPNRPTSIILKGFQLNIRSGQTVALVGLSGSGKSTIIQLLERFYDATKGNIFLDGIDIRQLNIHSLRSHFGLVTQEPVLFDLTIAENIAYGLEHVQMDEIISAAKRANIHQFIEQLSEGYETRIGEYGRFLSGGEKQRIAIARILIRRPKVFLFDEVTSAMDSYNEKIIQEALEEARIEDPSRTSIIIAHRLSTIRSCDVIYVVDEGRIIESGTHTELIERDGAYSKMLRQNVVL